MIKISLTLLLTLLLVAPVQAAPVVGAIQAVGIWYGAQALGTQLLVQIGVGLALTAAAYGLQALISGGGRRSEEARQDQAASVTLPEIDGLLEVRRAYGTIAAVGGVFIGGATW